MSFIRVAGGKGAGSADRTVEIVPRGTDRETGNSAAGARSPVSPFLLVGEKKSITNGSSLDMTGG